MGEGLKLLRMSERQGWILGIVSIVLSLLSLLYAVLWFMDFV